MKIVCDTYQKSLYEYMQEAMKSDIEEGNFCDALLDKIDGDDGNKEERMNSEPLTCVRNETDSLQF
ncbi:MAG TPA: hypothetical protein VE130_10750 [Nitrososphaeraceae archaeon]|nr:hypothetical protein [Nitrososphaeraceae archaeon]